MGEIINKKAAADDIAKDCRDTLAAAAARGGQVQTLAEQYLKPSMQVFEMLAQRLQAAEQVLAPLLAAQDAIDDSTDAMLGRLADELWNDVGRPASDPIYSLLFPEGVGFYTDGPDAEQPARMELLAELLEALEQNRWDLKATAQVLAISRPSLYMLLERFPQLRAMRNLTAEQLAQCYRDCGGNLDAMATLLHISQGALRRRLRELQLT